MNKSISSKQFIALADAQRERGDTTTYLGVFQDKKNGDWMAYGPTDNEDEYVLVGSFADDKEAARATLPLFLQSLLAIHLAPGIRSSGGATVTRLRCS